MTILKDSGGSTVELTDHGTVIKTAHDHEQYTKLRNAVRFHKLLGPKGLAPKLVADNNNKIEMEYVQSTDIRPEVPEFQDQLRRHAIRLLLSLKKYNIYHTDLTQYNYVVQKYRICPIDWSEARFGWEDVPNKRVGMDADWLYPSLMMHMHDHNRIVRKWLAIRPHIKHLRGYGTALDLGCLYGDITSMAASEGIHSRGIDNGAFDSSWLSMAESICDHKVQFDEIDMDKMGHYRYDVIFMLSSWSHFVEQTSFTDGEYLLHKVLDECGTLFFENHLFGDGPGHESLKTEDDHLHLFGRIGATAIPITTIDVGGRPFSRTVYKVTKN